MTGTASGISGLAGTTLAGVVVDGITLRGVASRHPAPDEDAGMSEAASGPIDVVMLRFPGNQFNGGIAPALLDPVEKGLIRVVDLLFVYKDVDGTVGSIELGGLGADLEPTFGDIDGQFGGGLLDAEDVEDVGAALDPGSSMAVLAVENLWAIPFIEAVRSAGGELVEQARVPSEVVDLVRQAAEEA
jgi:hypothetical protein